MAKIDDLYKQYAAEAPALNFLDWVGAKVEEMESHHQQAEALASLLLTLFSMDEYKAMRAGPVRETVEEMARALAPKVEPIIPEPHALPPGEYVFKDGAANTGGVGNGAFEPVITVTIKADNSDGNLTQEEWYLFCQQVHSTILTWDGKIHFAGSTAGWAERQSAAWIVAIDEGQAAHLKKYLLAVRKDHEQNSLSWTVGATEFI